MTKTINFYENNHKREPRTKIKCNYCKQNVTEPCLKSGKMDPIGEKFRLIPEIINKVEEGIKDEKEFINIKSASIAVINLLNNCIRYREHILDKGINIQEHIFEIFLDNSNRIEEIMNEKKRQRPNKIDSPLFKLYLLESNKSEDTNKKSA